ncbi:PLDc N-terminal domain-containing protein [Desulfovibrio sp. OttesenSCG-928-M14]|nr:PLDc N-terminal domain-containing protein [Desulfovibrio sp. OttesenSCG-928-M16]MDL2216533.1 PLDc N-terminal domain-containing protein [Desulfovibrio sp. OttesenSCG-928-M14]
MEVSPVLLYLLLGIPALPNLFGIWHAFNRVFPSSQERLIWLGVCVFVPIVGGLLYLIFGIRRSQKAPKI